MRIRAMRNRSIPFLLLAAAAVLGAPAAWAQTDAEYLRGKLSFRYVHTPNNLTSTVEILDNAAIAAGTETGSTFFASPSLSGLHGMVRGLLKPAGQGGNANLQYVAAKVVKILDKPVMIILLNDVSATLSTAAMNHWDACSDGAGHAWPCASNASTTDDQRTRCAEVNHETPRPRQDGSWAGSMTLGQAAFNGGSAGSAIGTFLHELVHTQDRSDRREHMFNISGNSHSYGADGDHYDIEAVPNLAATYQEGIANAVMLTVDGSTARRIFRWFAQNDVIMVEKNVPTAASGGGEVPCWTAVTQPSPDLWLYNQLRRAGVREVQRSPNPFPAYAYFRIRDLPPRFIAHNEMIIALVFSEYARHLGLPKFMNALKANDRTLFRVSTSPIAQLYNTLCRAGLDGRPLSAVTGRTEAGPKPYMIPLAYADYFTAYRSRSKDEYKAIFENMLPQEWVDLYWDGYKDTIRAAAPIDASHTPEFGNLTSIAIALGVNQSSAGH